MGMMRLGLCRSLSSLLLKWERMKIEDDDDFEKRLFLLLN